MFFGADDVKVLGNMKNIKVDVLFSGKNKDSLFIMSGGEAYVKKTNR